MAISFDGQVVLVTGAGNGLGRLYALDLARRGARVVVNDLGGNVRGEGADPSAAQAVVNEITSADGRAVANTDSVASFEGGANMVRLALETWGRLDAVIHNAGIIHKKRFVELTEADWDRIQAVHVRGAFNVLRNAWPVFEQQRYGRIVLTSSGGGIWGVPGHSDYGAAKMALVGLMNVLKQEGAEHGILVNVIAPGAGTRMTTDLFTQDRWDALRPEQVVPAVTYLASRECTDTGLIIEALGGRFNRAVIMQTPFVEAGPEPVEAEWVAERWQQITDTNEVRLPGRR